MPAVGVAFFVFLGVTGRSQLLALLRFAKHQPVAMLASGVVRRLPLRVDDRPFANLHYTVTGHEPYFACSIDQFDVCPLVPVVVNVVGDLAEKNAFFLQYAMRATHEWWERVREGVMIFLRGAQYQTKARIEVFLIVPTLIRNVRRVVHDHIETPVPKWHCCVVAHQARPMPRFDIQSDDRPRAVPPEAPSVNGRIENSPRLSARVEFEHSLK